jgi:hypothetical protein
MLVAGVTLSSGTVALLARRLHRAGHADLAMRVGLAVDTNRTDLALTRDDRTIVLAVLVECPTPLASLRDALHARE